MRISDVNQDGIGLDGLDPIAYFNGEFLKGDPTLSSTFENTRYLFASEENLEKFEEDPSMFIPVAGNPPSGEYQGDVSANLHSEYPATNRALEDEEFPMESNAAPALGDEEPDEEDLAKTNLYEAE
ncbi:MAG: hypothetical protein AAB316_16695 [Bacteroidota bacterium]